MAWMQDDANTVLRILSTPKLKYACVKTVTCFGHHVTAAPPSFDYRRTQDLHPRNQIWVPQSSVFTSYSSFCCRRKSGRSLQLVNDINLRVVTAWIMYGAVPPIPARLQSLLNTEGIRQSVIKLFFCISTQMYIHVRFLNPSVNFTQLQTQSFLWTVSQQNSASSCHPKVSIRYCDNVPVTEPFIHVTWRYHDIHSTLGIPCRKTWRWPVYEVETCSLREIIKK
jgi:hypothetical protein